MSGAAETLTSSRSSQTAGATFQQRGGGSGGRRSDSAAPLAWPSSPSLRAPPPGLFLPPRHCSRKNPLSPHKGSGGDGRWWCGPARPPLSRTAGDGDGCAGSTHAEKQGGLCHEETQAGQERPGTPQALPRPPGTQVKFTHRPEKPNMHHETQNFALSREKDKS